MELNWTIKLALQLTHIQLVSLTEKAMFWRNFWDLWWMDGRSLYLHDQYSHLKLWLKKIYESPDNNQVFLKKNMNDI